VTLTEDYLFGEACARIGIQADPASRPLRNNLAVALAYLGKQTDAEQQYRLIAKRFDNDFPEYVYQATGGLLQFRAGDVPAGRVHYNRAMGLAPDSMRTECSPTGSERSSLLPGVAAEPYRSAIRRLSCQKETHSR